MEIGFLLMICLASFIVSTISLGHFMRLRLDIDKQLKELKDGQFDAEQVMALYAKKYAPRPQIINEKHNILVVESSYIIPHWLEDQVSQEDMMTYLKNELVDKLNASCLEISDIREPMNFNRVVKARLRVLDPNNVERTNMY